MDTNNIISYITFRGDLNFSTSPFNDVDALLLSSIVGLDFEGLVDGPSKLNEVYIKYSERITEADHEPSNKEVLFKKMAESIRFSDILVDDFTKDINEEEEKTFYAMTFKLSRFKYFVAFRGTDGSLMSWKENFNTLYQLPTKGQEQAVKYLEGILSRTFAKCYVGGHSKGGNLAIYAAAFCDTKLQKKIINAYTFDGPGFIDDVSEHPGFIAIKDRIKAYIPESCVIGNLMRPPYERVVVASSNKGVFQHDSFSWQVNSFGFDTLVSTDLFSENITKKMDDWIYSIPKEEMNNVVSELFAMFEKQGIKHISEIINIDIIRLLGMIRSMTRLSSENRAFLMIIFKEIRNSK